MVLDIKDGLFLLETNLISHKGNYLVNYTQVVALVLHAKLCLCKE